MGIWKCSSQDIVRKATRLTQVHFRKALYSRRNNCPSRGRFWDLDDYLLACESYSYTNRLQFFLQTGRNTEKKSRNMDKQFLWIEFALILNTVKPSVSGVHSCLLEKLNQYEEKFRAIIFEIYWTHYLSATGKKWYWIWHQHISW